MTDEKGKPYKVTGVKPERVYTRGGPPVTHYTVDIEHPTGETSQIVVPEGPNAALDAHMAAMEHVKQVQALHALPIEPVSQ